MRTKSSVSFILSVIFIFTLTACDDDNGGTNPELPIATEDWISIVDQGAGSGDWKFEMWGDSTVTVRGDWIYDEGTPDEIQCPFTNGQAEIQGQNISFTASGTAYFTATPAVSSPFNLEVDGTTNNGQGNGTYTITFAAQGWPDPLTGTWTGTRDSGSGITI